MILLRYHSNAMSFNNRRSNHDLSGLLKQIQSWQANFGFFLYKCLREQSEVCLPRLYTKIPTKCLGGNWAIGPTSYFYFSKSQSSLYSSNHTFNYFQLKLAQTTPQCKNHDYLNAAGLV